MHPIGMPLEKKGKKIFFMVPAPVGISPGQRFRFEHYLDLLASHKIEYKIGSFYSLKDWNVLYTKGKAAQKIWIVCKGFIKRGIDLFRVIPYDYVYLFREAAPVGPPVFEWIIAKLLRKKIIYDFDDAIWIPVTSQYNRIAGYFKWFSKIASICKWSWKVSVGNDYLATFAEKYSKSVVMIPTVVDTEKSHNKVQDHSADRPAIGWTGTFSTLKYLDIVLPVLQDLQNEIDFTFIVIADRDPQLPLSDYRFIRWRKETEAQDILAMHIGLMPLYDDEISKGKCGFKAIQYMSLGIPAVVSPVGVNSVIVDEGINGFICTNTTEWKTRLLTLLENPQMRKQMGDEAKRKIVLNYSVTATRNKFLDLFA
jgi:glycosyltransferase involved in cell wall biosynthesis